jgi:hypothetical protein
MYRYGRPQYILHQYSASAKIEISHIDIKAIK